MDRHRIKADSKPFQLLAKLLIMDPVKRTTSVAAMNDEYFKEDPPPSSDVFGSYPIPYPKREFLSDDDSEEKPDNKARERNNGRNGNTGRGAEKGGEWSGGGE